MADKPPSKQQQILETVTELKTAMVGIPGTDDRGMAGDLKQTKAQVEHLAALHQEGNEHMADGGLTGKKKAGLWGGVLTLIAAALAGLVKAFTNGGNSGG